MKFLTYKEIKAGEIKKGDLLEFGKGDKDITSVVFLDKDMVNIKWTTGGFICGKDELRKIQLR